MNIGKLCKVAKHCIWMMAKMTTMIMSMRKKKNKATFPFAMQNPMPAQQKQIRFFFGVQLSYNGSYDQEIQQRRD